ncbi:Glycerol uptake facilitator protein [Caprobacter fermentans]|uniref:Glycerol uptake facilitator protein n=1 Tax=Caproicibacter fermentans TaxID=2576756 RepID=A0A6N8I4C3_9FIRM|nr:MIP/aquaporin family protein [Caproicibacter fermentans]MVB12808.1 Glycerol uptake facilitator protein [Caproicibacter fermentans]OCN02423.1 aquaporin [Clostridium sp. W14A]
MLPYIGEFVGTAILIILGDGVVANVTLNKSGMKGGGSVQITIAWGLAVMLPAFVFGAASGAHFNPALTIALAAAGSFAWSMVPGYIVSQILGGFCGGLIVYALFKDQFDETENQATILGCFSTGPAIRNLPRNFLSELVGTFLLVFTIMGIGNVKGAGGVGLNYLLVFGIIVSIGMSLGGLTGYAINPARDLGPRLAHAVLPIKNKGGSNWSYGLIVPIFGPIVGGLLACLLFKVIPW